MIDTKMGMFITFEGGEGSGKTIQSRLLCDYLKEKQNVVITREPGGTQGAEEIRKLLLVGENDKWDPVTESLLYLAARCDHWNKKIKPSLENGDIVISDRFQDSSIVYQGYCKNVNINIINSIYDLITDGYVPDRTYMILVDPHVGIQRSLNRNGNTETRFESMDISFHEKVNDCFLELYKKNKNRIILVDGNNTIENIQSIIRKDIDKILYKKSAINY